MKPKAYYQDRTVELDDGLTGEDSRGIQAITQDHPQVGREVVTKADYYVRDTEGRWRGVDIFGLFDVLMDDPNYAFGRTLSGEEYSRVMRAAYAEGKNGYTPKERKA